MNIGDELSNIGVNIGDGDNGVYLRSKQALAAFLKNGRDDKGRRMVIIIKLVK